MGDSDDFVPEEPHEAGVPEREPDAAHVEGAEVLADQAAETLLPRGFDRRQIREWAEAYVAERGAGDVDDFLEWVRAQERTASER